MGKLLGQGKSMLFGGLTTQYLQSVRVVDIILDINHPRAKELGGYDSIGTIFYGKIYEPNAVDYSRSAKRAKPLFHFLKQYPLINEVVIILKAPNRQFYADGNAIEHYYFPNLNIWNHQHYNALPEMQYYNPDDDETENPPSPEIRSYVDGVLTRTPEDNDVKVPLGKYFKENLNIQPLLPFEGDTIVEGRFGNSIRLGATAKEANDTTAYSTTGNTGDPITIIRNGALIEKNDNGWENTVENINTDHSTIYLTSNQKLPNIEIVSTHWQSWMAKHDELDVGKGKNNFDNLTKGAKPEVIELESDTSEEEFKKATDEELASEPEDPKEPPKNTYTVGLPESDEFQKQIPLEEDGPSATPSTTPADSNDINSDGSVSVDNIPPPPPPSPPTQEEQDIIDATTIPPDVPWSIKDVEGEYGTHKGFVLQEGYSRTDGEEKYHYFVKEVPTATDSLEEYVITDAGGGNCDSYSLYRLTLEIDDLIEEYENGERI